MVNNTHAYTPSSYIPRDEYETNLHGGATPPAYHDVPKFDPLHPITDPNSHASVVNDDGFIEDRGHIKTLPVITNTVAAQNYQLHYNAKLEQRMKTQGNTAVSDGIQGQNYHQRHGTKVQKSIQHFMESKLFTEDQKEALEARHDRTETSIALACTLEGVHRHRLAFVLDDREGVKPNVLETMKNKIRRHADLLQHSPASEIEIRTFTEPTRVIKCIREEKDTGNFYSELDKQLDTIRPMKQKTPTNVVDVFLRLIGAAVANKTQGSFLPYIHCAEILQTHKTFGSSATEAKRTAKYLMKVAVNRPDDIMPIGLFQYTKNSEELALGDNLDTLTEKFSSTRTYPEEQKKLSETQTPWFSKIYNEGFHDYVETMAPVNKKLDNLNEAQIFSQEGTEEDFGIPLWTEEEYNPWFSKTYDQQYRLHKADAQEETDAQQERDRKSKSILSRSPLVEFDFEFATRFDQIQGVPELSQKIEEMRQSGKLTPKIEQAIEELCNLPGEEIPIGEGLLLAEQQETGLTLRIDDSGSMTLRVNPNDTLSPVRIDVMRKRLKPLGPIMAKIPNKGVDISTLNGIFKEIPEIPEQANFGEPYESFQVRKASIIRRRNAAEKFNNTLHADLEKLSSRSETSPEDFIRAFNRVIDGITPNGNFTNMNAAILEDLANAESKDHHTVLLYPNDGMPGDRTTPLPSTATRDEQQEQAVKDFVYKIVNRNPEKTSLSLMPITEVPKDYLWSDFADKVVLGTNALGTKAQEVEAQRNKQGKLAGDASFHDSRTLLPFIPEVDQADDGHIKSERKMAMKFGVWSLER